MKEISLSVTHRYSLKGTGEATLSAVLHDPKHNVGHPVHLFTKEVPIALKSKPFIRVKEIRRQQRLVITDSSIHTAIMSGVSSQAV